MPNRWGDEGDETPKSVVNQVNGLDLDALFKATAMLDDGDEKAAAVMKQMYVKYAAENEQERG